VCEKDFKPMAAKLVENIRNNNGKIFIFQSFTETFALGFWRVERKLNLFVYD